MLRTRLDEALRAALRARDGCATSTLRLILAALKDRDIAERVKGNPTGLSDEQVVALLQSMIKQRQESIRLYRQGGREDLAKREADEIVVIEQFMPPQMDERGIEEAVTAAIAELEAKTLKDMGRVMSLLKARYAGQMDLKKAGVLLKERLR